ncbi:MAG TPA: tRNA (guanosine(37)-N1)-methyltransferase TrmD, partial [Nitrospiria bacterium]|nr:tRNA (guanosine(37)-N1)-methyltransferase TrmD [Nitrospiria bacterium]
NDSLLDYPHYTRPAIYRGMSVPEVLSSGNHGAIREWRRKQAFSNTLEKRPDLIKESRLSEEDRRILMNLKMEKDER